MFTPSVLCAERAEEEKKKTTLVCTNTHHKHIAQTLQKERERAVVCFFPVLSGSPRFLSFSLIHAHLLLLLLNCTTFTSSSSLEGKKKKMVRVCLSVSLCVCVPVFMCESPRCAHSHAHGRRRALPGRPSRLQRGPGAARLAGAEGGQSSGVGGSSLHCAKPLDGVHLCTKDKRTTCQLFTPFRSRAFFSVFFLEGGFFEKFPLVCVCVCVSSSPHCGCDHNNSHMYSLFALRFVPFLSFASHHPLMGENNTPKKKNSEEGVCA